MKSILGTILDLIGLVLFLILFALVVAIL